MLYMAEETKRSSLQQRELALKIIAEEKKIVLLDLEIQLKRKELLK